MTEPPIVFEEDPAPAKGNPSLAQREVETFAAEPAAPNTFVLRFGRFGHISWHAESGTAVLALIMLVFLGFITLAIVVASLFATEKGWLPSILQLLGNAISAVSGAVVGASAVSKARTTRK